MTDLDLLRTLRVEPLQKLRHDRGSFSCGEPRVDRYLHAIAAQNPERDASRAYVVCRPGSVRIVGFYAVNAHGIETSALPLDLQKRLPRYPVAPAIYLGMLGVDREFQGRGVGRFVLADAMRRSVMVAEQVGAAFIVLDALSEDAARLYRRLGFVDLPSHTGRLIIGMAQVRAALVDAG